MVIARIVKWGWLLLPLVLGGAAIAAPLPPAAPAAPPVPAASPVLSLDDCIRVAEQNQVDVLVGQQTVRGAKARLTQVNGAYYPQASVEVNPLLITGNANTSFHTLSSQGTIVSVTQNFYDGGLREANSAAARAGITQSTSALSRTRQTVGFTVTQNYFTVLRDQHLAEVADAQVQYAQAQLALVKGNVEAGAAAPADELPIQATLANAQVTQLAAHTTVRTALIALQDSMGLTTRTTFTIQDIAEQPRVTLQPLETYVAQALRQRPDVQELHAAVAGAKSNTTAARINLYPRPVISGEYDNLVSSPGTAGWGITGGLAFNLFDGGANKAAYDQARATLASAQYTDAQLAKDITADVQTAYLNLADAGERMTASAIGVQAAQKNYDAQTARYHEGLATPLDLLNAQVALTTAQSADVQARYDDFTARAQLAYAIGNPGGLNGK